MSKVKVLLISPYSAKQIGGIGTWSKVMLDYCEGRDDVNLKFQNTQSSLKGNMQLQHGKLRRLVLGCWDSLTILVKEFWNIMFFRPEVVHYTSSASWALAKDRVAAFIAVTIFRRKFIIHWRCGTFTREYNANSKLFQRWMNVIRHSTCSIFIDKQDYVTAQKIGIKNACLIPNPISSHLQLRSENLAVDSIQTQRHEGEVLFVGQILKTKGALELMRVCAKNPNVRKLLLAGPCLHEMRAELEGIAKTREGNWYEFLGELKREDVFKYYEKCNVFCLPTYTEGFPNVILESMAHACPIVTTPVGAIPEMLEEESGITVPVQDEEALDKALTEVLTHRGESLEMGKRARKRVLKNYTIDVVYKQYHNLWTNSYCDR